MDVELRKVASTHLVFVAQDSGLENPVSPDWVGGMNRDQGDRQRPPVEDLPFEPFNNRADGVIPSEVVVEEKSCDEGSGFQKRNRFLACPEVCPSETTCPLIVNDDRCRLSHLRSTAAGTRRLQECETLCL